MKTKVICLLATTTLFLSCNKNEPVELSADLVGLDTIKNLSEMTTKRAIWNDNGIYRLVTEELNNDPYDKQEQDGEYAEEAGKPENETMATCSKSFSGNDRKAAKISFSTASTTTNYTFGAFRNTLQTDTFMRSLSIPKASTSNRVSQENRNVNITTSYLYAIKRSEDGDYHLVVGDENKANLTTCESSGLPSSSASSYNAIKSVQDAILAKFGTNLCGKTSYTTFSPPILIDRIKGSLFFDVDHAAGTVGPTGLRSTTAWEIHPLSELVF